MIVLHAGLLDNRFLVWGESPAESASPGQPASRAAQRRPRGAQARRATPLPYDAGHAALAAALAEVVPDLVNGESGGRKTTRCFTQAVAWLPTVADEPVASSPLVAEPPTSRGDATLLPWTVTAAHLPAAQAVTLLCHCVGKAALTPGVIVGKDVAFWTTALRFAAELVTRQQFLPSVAQENGAYRACWKPVWGAPDQQRLSGLAKTMPAAARALTGDANAPPEVPAGDVLSVFVDDVVDYLVRGAATPAPIAIHAVASRVRPLRRGRTARRQAFDSLHDQWLSALRASDGTLVGDAVELERFAGQVQEWRRPLSVTATAPFRLCFRLDEPATAEDAAGNGGSLDRLQPGNAAWRVHYLLQAADDPSLLVPAEEVWRARGPHAAVLRRPGFNAKEYLLRGLGQACGLSPRIEAGLKTPTPSGHDLDATGAHEFLTETAAALEQAGFAVLLPAWWTRKGTKLRLIARANVRSPKLVGGPA